jgi:hypothetical protein
MEERPSPLLLAEPDRRLARGVDSLTANRSRCALRDTLHV